jgi:hypothetical protein
VVVEIPMLGVLDPRQDLALRRAIAFQLIRDDHPRHVLQPLQQLAEELLRGFLVPAALYEDIEDVAVLIHGPPEIMAFLVDREEHLIQMPRVTRPRTPALQLIGILLRMKRSSSTSRWLSGKR